MEHSFGSPELSRSFETALSLPAGGLNGSRSNRPAATMYCAIVHPAGMGCKIVLLSYDHFACISGGGFQGGYLGEHFLLASMAQLMAKGFDPLCRSYTLLPMESSPQVPQVLAGMIEVQHFFGSPPTVLRHVPNPGRAISHHKPRLGSPQPSAQSLPVQPSAKLHRVSLPAHDTFVFDDPATTVGAGGFLLRIINPGLPFVPFHAVFCGFAPAPARTPLPHLPPIEHQHTQLGGGSFGLRFWRHSFELFPLPGICS